ncbi:hypothetical protein BsWGS_25346 [Bradybaena similaris]
MQQLCLLMMSQFLATFATGDIAVEIKGDVNHLTLTKDNLNMMHMCLCNSLYSSCTFNEINQNLTHTYSEASESYSSTEYSNRYSCSLLAGSINCTRRIQNGQHETAIKHDGKSFSLYDNKTCDINCLDVVWDDTVTNISINTDIISGELCAASPPSSTQDKVNTKRIIIIAAVSIVLIVLVISVIIAVCVRSKRQSRFKKTARYTVNSESDKDPEVETINGLYAVSSEYSWRPNPDKEQECLYYEVEKDKRDSQEIPGNSQLESNNLYSQLHPKTENSVNTYDILPPSGSHF